MKKSARRAPKTTTLCMSASFALLLCYFISFLADFSRYDSGLNSAPFSVWVLARSIEFLLPALVFFVIGCIAAWKSMKKKRENG